MRILLLILTSLLLTGCKTGNVPSMRATEELVFTTEENKLYQFVYSDTSGNTYLRQLRQANYLLDITKSCKTDLERLCEIMNWTSKQWKHSGVNTPSKSDALTILKEAREGKRFRCVEYGTVLSASLNAIGIKARTLGLETKFIETAKAGAGHVLAEAYLPDLGKWVVADAQFNVIPTLNGLPLNAVEFQKAIASGEKFQLIDRNGAVERSRAQRYLRFIPAYLYYFNIRFDCRQGLSIDRLQIEEKSSLMLVPVGAKNPTVFQITSVIDNCLYTHSTGDFYRKP